MKSPQERRLAAAEKTGALAFFAFIGSAFCAAEGIDQLVSPFSEAL